ncbi:MAG TPA: DUF1501 domain-containing protein, partial [Pirellulaceae bacterium]|nr:DUF1501 domain-containing protein [Pirellulaceae bacterium]
MTSTNQHRQKYPCGRIQRRAFLQDAGRGLAAIALGSLLGGPAARGADAPTNGAAGDANGPGGPHSEGEWRPPSGRPHFAPKAKSVIWFFMLGGTSHLESFDPKPELDKYAGKTVEQSPYKNVVLDSPYYRKNVRDFAGTPRALMATLYPTQIKFQK